MIDFEEYIEKRQYQVLLDDVTALEDNEALFNEMNYEEPKAEEHEETPEEYLERMTRENKHESDSDDDVSVSDFSEDDLLV